MDTVTAKKEYADLRAKALAIPEQAAKQDRPLTQAEQAQLASLVSQAKAKYAEIEQHRVGMSADELDRIIEAGLKGEGGTGALGLKASTTPHPWAVAIEKTCATHGVKAFAMPSGSVPLTPLATVPFSLGQVPAALVQAIGLRGWPATGGRSVQYLRRTVRTNAAAIWTSGTKPVSDFTTVLVQADAATIAHLAAPINTADLADFEGLDRWVQSELVYGISRALESAVVTAAGPEPALTGLLHLTGSTPVAAAGDAPATIMAATVALENAGYPGPYTAVMNPGDWAGIALMKASGSGEYQYPTLPAAGAAPSLLGVSIVTTPAIVAKTAIVANLRSQVELYEREVPTVVWGTTSTTSGAAQASFEKNQIAARGEGRFALVVPQPAAIAVATLP